MKRYLGLLLVCLLLAASFRAVAAEDGTVLYVAPGGTGNGTLQAPFGSVQQAIEVARQVSGSVTVLLEEGNYFQTQPITLTEQDKDLIISAQPGKEVRLTGGCALPYSGFTPVTDSEILSRIVSQRGRQSVMQISLPDYGITDYGEIKVQGFLSSNRSGYAPTLTYQDSLLPIACYPNGSTGYLSTTSILKDGSTSTAVMGGLKEIQYQINDDRFQYWTEAEDVWALAYLCHDWADTTVPATFDFSTGTVTSYVGGTYYAKTGRRVKFFNLLEELDDPGEWYLDRTSGILYLIPPENISAQDVLQFTSYEKNLVTAQNCENVTFRRIHFSGTRSYGAYASGTDGLVFEQCTFSAIGNAAVFLNKCWRSGLRDCSLHDLGSWGIYMNQCGDRSNLIPGECFAENCEFEKFSQYRRTYSPAVHMFEDVGNTVSHCEFHDAPHFAIRYDSNDNVIEYSEFYNLCQETADTGAIYSGRYWNTRGNEIRYNYFHDLHKGPVATGYGLHGVYLDDAHSSTNVHHNIFYNVSSVSLMGGGRDNAFTNNLMVDCDASLTFDARCTTWMAWGEGSGIRVNTDKVQNWQTSAAWSKYPHLQNLYEDEPQYPKYNILENNILLHTPAFQINRYVSQYGTVRNNVATDNSGVVADYQGGDYSPSLQAAELTGLAAFTEIPLDQIGVIRRVTSLEREPEDQVRQTLLYSENFIGYRAQESNGSVESNGGGVSLTAATVEEEGSYSIPRTRMTKEVSVPVTPGRSYRVSLFNRFSPLQEDPSLTLQMLNGLVFDQQDFSYRANEADWKQVQNGEFYYNPAQSQQGSDWSAVYSFDQAMTLKKLFFMVHIPNQIESEDVWGGGIRYTLESWRITEQTVYHEIKMNYRDGGTVEYTNQDLDGGNAYRNAPAEPGGIALAEHGTSPELTITPEEGWQLTSVKTMDGRILQYHSQSPVTLTISDVSQSGTVDLVFDQVEAYSKEPGVAEHSAYVFGGETMEYENDEGETVSGPVCYAYTSLNNYPYSRDSESGFLLSLKGSTAKPLRLPIYDSEGEMLSASPLMQFGIKLYGQAIRQGKDYLLVPYVREGEKETTGAPIAVETGEE